MPEGAARPDYVVPDPAPEEVFRFVLVGVIEPRCQFPGCHDRADGRNQPAGGLDLTTDPYAALMGTSTAVNRPLVVPYDVAASYLMEKVTRSSPAVGERMPPDSPLDEDQLGLLRRWIDAGAF